MNTARTVACPQCGAPVMWTAESKSRPFCSQRCKLIDLGAWATETYRVAVSQATDEDAIEPPSDTRAPRND